MGNGLRFENLRAVFLLDENVGLDGNQRSVEAVLVVIRACGAEFVRRVGESLVRELLDEYVEFLAAVRNGIRLGELAVVLVRVQRIDERRRDDVIVAANQRLVETLVIDLVANDRLLEVALGVFTYRAAVVAKAIEFELYPLFAPLRRVGFIRRERPFLEHDRVVQHLGRQLAGERGIGEQMHLVRREERVNELVLEVTVGVRLAVPLDRVIAVGLFRGGQLTRKEWSTAREIRA